MKNKKLQEFDLERSIIHLLLLHSSLLSDIGLCRGKTGLVIFFMYYYKLTNETLYEDVAGELIDEIEEELHNKLPISFETGLSGIGWGMDYLIQKGFVEGDSKEVCEEIDRKIMETDPRRITDYSFNIGIGGILLYVLNHCKTVFEQRNEMPFDDCYLDDLYIACVNLRFMKDLPKETLQLADIYIMSYVNKEIFANTEWDITMIMHGIPNLNEKSLSKYPLGLNEGLAGVLLEKKEIKKS